MSTVAGHGLARQGDGPVSLLEILVEAVALGDEVLLPLAEAGLFHLDLLGEALAERLFLFLELGVLDLLHLGLAELARLHLRLAVVFVVRLLGRRDEVEHVRPDQERAELLEVAVVLVLDCTEPKVSNRPSLDADRAKHTLGDSPEVLPTLDGPAVGGGYLLCASDDGERHRGLQSTRQLAGIAHCSRRYRNAR